MNPTEYICTWWAVLLIMSIMSVLIMNKYNENIMTKTKRN